MRRHLRVEDLGDLLDMALVAVLATRRSSGDLLLSPVWHEWRDGGFNVATGHADLKVRHLRRDPRANIVVYEHTPPYRGVEVRAEAQLLTDGALEAACRLAVRYLGAEAGPAYADRSGDDTLIRLEPGVVRAWDFSDDYD